MFGYCGQYGQNYGPYWSKAVLRLVGARIEDIFGIWVGGPQYDPTRRKPLIYKTGNIFAYTKYTKQEQGTLVAKNALYKHCLLSRTVLLHGFYVLTDFIENTNLKMIFYRTIWICMETLSRRFSQITSQDLCTKLAKL